MQCKKTADLKVGATKPMMNAIRRGLAQSNALRFNHCALISKSQDFTLRACRRRGPRPDQGLSPSTASRRVPGRPHSRAAGTPAHTDRMSGWAMGRYLASTSSVPGKVKAGAGRNTSLLTMPFISGPSCTLIGVTRSPMNVRRTFSPSARLRWRRARCRPNWADRRPHRRCRD